MRNPSTFRFPVIFKKFILTPFSIMPSITESFLKSLQFPIKFIILLATNSDVVPLLLTEFCFYEICCFFVLSISSLRQCSSDMTARFLKYWLQIFVAWIV